jgi:hypothetical protein
MGTVQACQHDCCVAISSLDLLLRSTSYIRFDSYWEDLGANHNQANLKMSSEYRGVDFEAARALVVKSIKKVLAEHDARIKSSGGFNTTLRGIALSDYGPCIACITLFLLSASSRISLEFRVGLLLSAIAVFGVTALNLLLGSFRASTESNEIRRELEEVLRDYEHFAAQCKRSSQAIDGDENSPAIEEDAFNGISSGHTLISIVTVYRNGHWLRMPSLGLVEGDIIALMAGDITPGKVIEVLSSDSPNNNNGASVSTGAGSSAQPHSQQTPSRSSLNVERESGYILKRADSTNCVYPSAGEGTDQLPRRRVYDKGTKIHLREGSDRERRYHHTHAKSQLHLHHLHRAGASDGVRMSASTGGIGGSASDGEGMNSREQPSAGVGDAQAQAQAPLYQRHRALPSNSPELLVLSGDVRCFEMAETPIESFCQRLLAAADKSDSATYSPMGSIIAADITGEDLDDGVTVSGTSLQEVPPAASWLRTLIVSVFRYGTFTAAILLLTLIALYCLRYYFLPKTRDQLWPQALSSAGVIILSMFPQVFSVRLGFFLSEVAAMANFLATTEVVLRGDLIEDTNTADVDGNDISGDPNRTNNLEDKGAGAGAGVGNSAGNAAGSGHDNVRARAGSKTRDSKDPSGMPDEDAFSVASSSRRGGNNSSKGRSEMNANDENEFNDDDIDDKAEEIAESHSTQVQWGRLIQYVSIYDVFDILHFNIHL